MASINSKLKSFDARSEMRDYEHASKTFVENNFEIQPQHSHLFHVIFNFTPDAATLFDTTDKLEIPILVKSCELPQYTIDVQTYNQYNRKVQSHHSINYQPINVTFHDDSKELIRKLWHTYYIFYNADPTYSLDTNSYTPYDKYGDRTVQQWGLQRGNKRFFSDIRIYSMHNHKFVEHTLINPIITAFNHDTHRYADSSMLEHRMQLAYETVKYARGFVNNINPKGFGDIHYDNDSSDIAPSNFKDRAFVDGTLRDTTATDTTDFFSDNVIGTIKEQDLIYETNRNVFSGDTITDTLSILANNLLTGQKPNKNILVPLIGDFSQIGGKYLDNITAKIESGDIFTGTAKITDENGTQINTNKYSNISNSSSYNAGFANQLPKNDGTRSKPNNLSDNYFVKKFSSVFNSKDTKKKEYQANLNSNQESVRENAKEKLSLWDL